MDYCRYGGFGWVLQVRTNHLRASIASFGFNVLSKFIANFWTTRKLFTLPEIPTQHQLIDTWHCYGF